MVNYGVRTGPPWSFVRAHYRTLPDLSLTMGFYGPLIALHTYQQMLNFSTLVGWVIQNPLRARWDYNTYSLQHVVSTYLSVAN